MHYRQILTNQYCPFIHANGPSKYEESWDKVVDRYFVGFVQIASVFKQKACLEISLVERNT